MSELLLRDGRAVDGSGRLDVAVSGGRISAVGPSLAAEGGAQVVDLGGRLVSPGLFDLHSHVYWGATTLGAWPDEVCLGSGVTATADGGSAGSDTFAGFARFVAGTARTRVFGFVNLSRLGMAGFQGAGELVNPAYADPAGVAAVLRDFPDVAVGVKLRASTDVVGGSCLTLLRAAVDAAGTRPVMVHIGGAADPIDAVLALLRPGDIVTHFQTPKANGLLDPAGKVHPAARDARERGVLFDCGHGKTHWSAEVARGLLDQGFPPDVISTDLSATSFATLRPGLVTVLDKWRALGLPLADVFRMATSAPAAAVGKGDEIGRLAVGSAADVAVFDDDAGERLVPWLTLRAGEVAWTAERKGE